MLQWKAKGVRCYLGIHWQSRIVGFDALKVFFN